MKILGLSLYGTMAASNRYRLTQYVSCLAEHDIELRVHHLLDDVYLIARYEQKPVPWGHVINCAWKRLTELLSCQDYDGFILYGELFPLMPAWVERLILSKPYIYDFDDAFFLKYRRGKLVKMQFLLGNKFDKVISGAAAVTAGNAYLAEYARAFNQKTHILPTVVDTSVYVPDHQHIDDVFTIGWVGSPSTAPYLSQLIKPLSALGREVPVRLIVIGGKAPDIPNVEIMEVPWSEKTEIAWINRFDVGIMPLPDDEWAKGKCAFKLIQYMACGVPVVASKVGANIDVVENDCGFLVEHEKEWIEVLSLLREKKDYRVILGQMARNKIEKQYSLMFAQQKLISVIKDVFALSL
jgi:glycosyltransferase involved in cell wall biosynthesis